MDNAPMSPETTPYDETYYKQYTNHPYERSATWQAFFGEIARRVVADFAPKTALDAGCAIGMLVEALRNCGVDAQGFDISAYATSQVPEHLAPHVFQGDILNPAVVSQHYDLVICIEVLEHLSPEQADQAIANLCAWGDTVLLSTTPDHYAEPTHTNVQKPGYWAERFAAHGWLPDPRYDASYVSPWAVVFQRRTPTLPLLARDYADQYWERARQVQNLRHLVEQAQQQNAAHLRELDVLREALAHMQDEATRLDAHYRQDIDARHAAHQAQIEALMRDHAQALAGLSADGEQRATTVFEAERQKRIALFASCAARLAAFREEMAHAQAQHLRRLTQATNWLRQSEAHQARLLTDWGQDRAAWQQHAAALAAVLSEQSAQARRLSAERDQILHQAVGLQRDLDSLRDALQAAHTQLADTQEYAKKDQQGYTGLASWYEQRLAGETTRLTSEADRAKAELHAARQQIGVLEGQMEAMKSTFGWRLHSRLASMRNALFPAGSRRERGYFLVRSAVGILFSQGLLAFTSRLGRWLRGERRYYRPRSVPDPKLETRPLPVATQTQPTLTIFTVLFIVPLPDIASKRYRVYNVQEQLGKHNITAHYVDEQNFLNNPDQALLYHVIVFARVTINPTVEAWLPKARALGLKIVFEIDDHVFDPAMLPHIAAAASLPYADLKIYLDGMAGYRAMLTHCDYFIGSTQPLASAARALGPKAYIIRNGLNDRQVHLAEAALQRRRERQALRERPDIRVGYLSGSATHSKDFDVVVPALSRLMEEYGNLRLVIQGHLEPPPALAAYSKRIERRPFVHWEHLVEETAQLDINLAPLEPDNPFTAGKSALKYFEAALVEVPTVATPVEDFCVAIAHGETGLLAATPEAWYECLRTLINDADLRQRMGQQARQDALTRYTSAAMSANTLAVYQHILRDAEMTVTPTPVFTPDMRTSSAGALRPVRQAAANDDRPALATPRADTPNAKAPATHRPFWSPLFYDLTGGGRRVSDEDTGVIFQAHLSLYEYAARLVKGKRVLDAGCGTGYGSLALAKAGAQAVLAVDSDEMIIDRATQRFQHPALTFQAADLLSLSLDPGSLDVVYASNILHQLTDVDRFLDRVLPALSAGAVLFVAVPHIWSAAALEQNLQSKHHLWNLHPRQWMSKIGRYFGEVECLRHWLNAGVTPDWSPTSLLKAADFAFEREELSALMSSGETVSLVLVARRPRRTPLPAALEAQGYPITWDAKVVQAAQSRIQTALRQEQSSDPEPLAAAHPTSAAASADVAGSKTESKTESSAESGAALAALVAPAGGTDGTDSTDSTDGADLATLLQNVPPAPSEATPDQPLRFPLDALFAEVEPPSVASMGLRFKESALAHHFLDGLSGLEIGAAAHNTFGLRTQNVGITAAMDAEDYEFYKAAQISYCGTYAEIDIPGLADDIPVPESSQDFVLHSHVWEHLPNPLGALEEWVRVVRSGGYIFAIVPKRNSEPSDVDRPITTLEEHIRNYDLRSTHPERGLRDGTLGLHYSLFTPETLRQIGAWFNAHHPAVQLSEVAFMETDDKVGNGHLIVWQVLERPTA